MFRDVNEFNLHRTTMRSVEVELIKLYEAMLASLKKLHKANLSLDERLADILRDDDEQSVSSLLAKHFYVKLLAENYKRFIDVQTGLDECAREMLLSVAEMIKSPDSSQEEEQTDLFKNKYPV